jgi:hypothetical protein
MGMSIPAPALGSKAREKALYRQIVVGDWD